MPAHALTLAAAGLFIALQRRQERPYLLAAAALGAVCGIAMVAMALATRFQDLQALVLGGVIGVAIAGGYRAPLPVGVLLMALPMLAVIFDSVPSVLSVQATLTALAGTGLSGSAVVGLVALAAASLPDRIGRIAIRIAGAWLAALAAMLTALRLAS